MSYLFGDSERAAARLGMLAEVFAESTRDFLLSAAVGRRHLALDLGCGPGHTTHLLARTLQCERTVGLDKSEHFITLARKTVSDKISFHVHDVTATPFPEALADIVFCRYLLSHLQDPAAIVAGWATQVRPGGLLMIEENEWIHTDNQVFALYLNIVDAMLERQSAQLYVGKALDEYGAIEALRPRMSRVIRMPAATHVAAAMFYMNIQTWKTQPFIQENYDTAVIDRLEQDLRALAEKSASQLEIMWGLRQVVFERV
jgi:SAM-dependent methyltransferase